jgi:hypothetical protein
MVQITIRLEVVTARSISLLEVSSEYKNVDPAQITPPSSDAFKNATVAKE